MRTYSFNHQNSVVIVFLNSDVGPVGNAAENISGNSPVDLRFDLEQIATETNSSKIVSIGLKKQHIKNHMKSI